jgi:hypothetical protein
LAPKRRESAIHQMCCWQKTLNRSTQTSVPNPHVSVRCRALCVAGLFRVLKLSHSECPTLTHSTDRRMDASLSSPKIGDRRFFFSHRDRNGLCTEALLYGVAHRQNVDGIFEKFPAFSQRFFDACGSHRWEPPTPLSATDGKRYGRMFEGRSKSAAGGGPRLPQSVSLYPA